ncbi:MAG TPA: amino acid adenylation domain-containing protein [Rhodocyclaceae bacterium]|nr:amino acid adenylation domain-containing protein [Rhodocyclaceae bacterium]
MSRIDHQPSTPGPDLSGTTADLPEGDLCLHQLFEIQAARHPDRDALVYEQQRLTYGELDRRAEALARRLRSLGAQPDRCVGLCLERSLDLVVALLAILKSGAAYLPLDPALPRQRLDFMLEDAGVGLVLTQESLLGILPDAGLGIVCVDGPEEPSDPALAAAPPPRPSSLAYVIYTSGSTGQPKGVCIEHRNIVAYVRGLVERLELAPGLNYATVSTIAADLGNSVIFPALATGGCLHVISQIRSEDPALLADVFEREGIDVLKIVPSHLAALQSGRHPERLMPRRCLILGGEASRLDWIEQLRALAPGCAVFNHYGPTETTVGVLAYRVEPGPLPATASGTLPLGRPLPGSLVYLMDEEGRPVAPGETGEICIGGRGVARGYLNRPKLTAEKFQTDPFSSEPGARLYHSGDLGRLLPGGDIEFCGRLDHQVKINGYRVELGEIETALARHPGVREALVTTQEDGSGRRQVVAYVVTRRVEQPLWERPVHILPDGAPVAHLNRNETEYIYREIFELQAYLRNGITIADGDVVIDAGANIGLFTLFASRLARDLRILAFEPNPAAYACLKANAEAWGAAHAITCLPHGLSRENTSAELTYFEGLSLLSGFYADAATERDVVRHYVANQQPELLADEGMDAQVSQLIDDKLRARTVSAQLRTLSSVIAEEGLERIDLLKINVEKSELDVLLGLGPEVWPKLRQLVIEVDQAENLELITPLLQRHGFEVTVEQDPLLRHTDLHYVYGRRPEAAASGASHPRQVPDPAPDILAPALLRRHLAEKLPAYMIPASFMLLESLPLNANGKIDRQALPPHRFENIRPARAQSVPRTATEQTLAALWSELLKVEPIGIDDDFFDLGGDSLLAIRAVSGIRDAFEMDLPLRHLLEHPTIAGLGEVIDSLRYVSQAQAAGAGDGREEMEL